MVRINLIPGIRRQIRLEEIWRDVCTGLFIGLAITIVVCGYLVGAVLMR